MVVAGLVIGLAALILFAPKILDLLDARTNAQKALEEKQRAEKGAIANTFDFLFGEGFSKKSLGPTGMTERPATPEELSERFSTKFGSEVTFDPSTKVDPNTGIITADKGPTFKLTEKEKLIIRNKQQKTKGRLRFG